MKKIRLIGITWLVILPLIAGTIVLADQSTVVTGSVVDPAGQPVIGATVILTSGSTTISGTSSDSLGAFRIAVPEDCTEWALRFSCVGYETVTRSKPNSPTNQDLRVMLQPQVVEVAGYNVRPTFASSEATVILHHRTVAQAAQASLVPSNPVAALQGPQIARVGSSHSSQIRVHGTNPVYFFNGLNIGTDPAHYGMFSIVPAAAVDRIAFTADGSSAEYQLPAIIELEGPVPFGLGHGAELQVGTIDATGSARIAGQNWFSTLTVRKSVLDRLVKQFDVSTDRRTLPPTNFQDVFVSAGLRLSPQIRLLVDHYDARDFLCYNSAEATGVGAGIDTQQHAWQRHTGVKIDGLFGSWRFRSQVAVRAEERHYHALPEDDRAVNAVRATIDERVRSYQGAVTLVRAFGQVTVSTGAEVRYDEDRSFALTQHNWNFLPPFSSTDKPYVYQDALNTSYAEYTGNAAELYSAQYLSVARCGARLAVEAGMRLDRYDRALDATAPALRARVKWRVSDNSSLELSGGTFSHSPVENILEPYQPLIRAYLSELKPVRTALLTATVNLGGLAVSGFEKRIYDQPIISPDFSSYDKQTDLIEPDFIKVEPGGYSAFTGLAFTWSGQNLAKGRLDMSASYAYTEARKLDHGVVMDYDTHAPHQITTELHCRAAARLSLGVSATYRSGYPYSPLLAVPTTAQEERYSASYYYSALARENSLRFAAHASVNVSARYAWDAVELFAALNNVTNRANPIISSGSGVIYDAGIMPTIGVKIQL